MASKKPLERYVEAGKEFTETSRKKVQTIARDFAKEGEAGREHAEDWADEFVARGRRGAEQFSELVRHEIRRQIQQFNLGDESGRDQGRPAVRRAHDEGRRTGDGGRNPHDDRDDNGRWQEGSGGEKDCAEKDCVGPKSSAGEEGDYRPEDRPFQKAAASKTAAATPAPARRAAATKRNRRRQEDRYREADPPPSRRPLRP